MYRKSARAAGVALAIAIAGGEARAQGCTLGGVSFGEGAAQCLSGVKDGEIARVLFACTAGQWTATDRTCPDDFAYFCKVGPYAVDIGETLPLADGPSELACVFPGQLKLREVASTPAPAPSAGAPSRLLAAVQRFLSDENPGDGTGIDCARDPCDGRADDKTTLAIAAHIRANAGVLSPDELADFGIIAPETAESAIRQRSLIDIVPLFVRVFDVPTGN
jgi:hypothetical protein